MLGLYGVYKRCHIQDAKRILMGMADWFGYEVLDKLNHENIQKMLVCEHGSINESYIDVYKITGDKKYLEWAKTCKFRYLCISMPTVQYILSFGKRYPHILII